jgi:hypothetical protein
VLTGAVVVEGAPVEPAVLEPAVLEPAGEDVLVEPVGVGLVVPVVDGLVVPVVDGLVVPVVDGLVVPVVDGLVVPAVDGLVVSVLDGLVVSVLDGLVVSVLDGLVVPAPGTDGVIVAAPELVAASASDAASAVRNACAFGALIECTARPTAPGDEAGTNASDSALDITNPRRAASRSIRPSPPSTAMLSRSCWLLL